MAALMSPAHTCLGKGSAPQKGHLLQPFPSSEEDTRVAMPPTSHGSHEHAAATGASQLPQGEAQMGSTKLFQPEPTVPLRPQVCGEPTAAEATHQLNLMLIIYHY